MRPDLVEWQWSGYPQFHGSKTNLLIHIIGVPRFILSAVNVIWAVAPLQGFFAGFALGGMMTPFMAQAVGLAQQKTPASPFDGPLDALSRIFVEQFFNCP